MNKLEINVCVILASVFVVAWIFYATESPRVVGDYQLGLFGVVIVLFIARLAQHVRAFLLKSRTGQK